MILRDCTSNGGSLYRVEEAASRKWDILCMKVCEDHDSKLYTTVREHVHRR